MFFWKFFLDKKETTYLEFWIIVFIYIIHLPVYIIDVYPEYFLYVLFFNLYINEYLW